MLDAPDSYLVARLNEVVDRAFQAQSRIEAHEAVCAERYGAILADHKRLTTRLNWVLGAIMVTCGVDLFGSSEAFRIMTRLFLAVIR
jgi:hypothetical protein